MNNVNSPNGQGGFQSGSFRVCDCAVPEPRMKCSENGNTSYCGICSKSFNHIHSLETSKGKLWYDSEIERAEYMHQIGRNLLIPDGYLEKIDSILKEKRTDDKIHYDGKGGWETESFRVNSKKIIENLKATRIHFLDTPAGRKWENIVAWRIAQKENKKK
jgi:hypothetical protein